MEKDKFDIFCLWDTIEHLREPHLYIKKISEHIKKGGIISLTTGDIDSFVARLQRDRWRLIHPPEHLYYFSRKTISALLEKYGFKVINVKYSGFHRRLGLLCSPFRRYAIYKFLESNFISDISIYLNLFDIMHVTARKE